MIPDLNWAFRQTAPMPSKFVLVALANRADKNHRCFPSIRRIADETCMNPRTVMRAIRVLENLGLIGCERKQMQNTIYTLKVTDSHTRRRRKEADMEADFSCDPPTLHKVTESHPAPGDPESLRVTVSTLPGDSQYISRVTESHSIPKERTQKRTQRGREAHLPPGLGEFHSVRLDDPQIAKLQAKLNGNFQSYIDRLDRYSQTHPKEFAKYRSHYAVLLTWFDRDVAEGKIKPQAVTYTPEQIAERIVQLRKEGALL